MLVLDRAHLVGSEPPVWGAHWAQPELHGAKMLSPEETVQYSVDYLEKVAPDSRRWAVTP